MHTVFILPNRLVLLPLKAEFLSNDDTKSEPLEYAPS